VREESPLTEPSKAVFLSYASEDAEAAQRICEALRAGGVKVWLDKSGLSGGDAWDASIRRQIKDCALFIPVISANTQAREEGYFRLEWKLAVDRSHLMAESKPFLLPVVVDDTADANALVPDRFREVQWARLPGGQAPANFGERVLRLLGDRDVPEQTPVPARGTGGPAGAARAPAQSRMGIALGAGAIVLTAAVAGFLYLHGRAPVPILPAAVPSLVKAPAAFSPPPYSVAVLPFVNMSGDPKQDYFSDGLSEELLNSLVTVRDLQVAARTSSFYFKGEKIELQEVAHKLNVGAILEGSVRRDGNHVRITAQLINTVTGFHLWSQTYDRDMKDMLKLQTDIATEVSHALEAKLLGESAGARNLGGTENANAFDAYLRGEKMLEGNFSEAGYSDPDSQGALAAYNEAIRLDPHFANAYVGNARVLDLIAGAGVGGNIRRTAEEARAAADKAIEIAPTLGIAHAELAWILGHGLLDFRAATAAMERAVALSPGDARVLSMSAILLAYVGKAEESIAQAKRSVVLDPLNRSSHIALGTAYFSAHRYHEAVEAYNRALTINPDDFHIAGRIGYAYDALGDYANAIRTCSTKQINYIIDVCLALAYDGTHRRADSDAQIAKFMARDGDSGSYQYAEIYAQRGDIPRALTWLDTAERVGDTGLHYMRVDPFVDPLRTEPRFQAIERKLNFPN
jgi:TolB-like protein/Flp pilus assembly protein TadD